MKIIGQTKEGFILDASRQELANLIGFYSGFNIAQLKVGVKIEIHHMYEQLYSLSKMEKEVNIVSDKLQKYAEELRPLMPLTIECPTEGE